MGSCTLGRAPNGALAEAAFEVEEWTNAFDFGGKDASSEDEELEETEKLKRKQEPLELTNAATSKSSLRLCTPLR